MKACPSRDQLASLLAEQLGETEGAALEVHVENCVHCRHALAQLSEASEDGDLRTRRQLEAKADLGTLDFLERMKSRRPSPEDATATAQGLNDATLSAGGPLPSVAGYEILVELGRGGMGVVYQARHHGLNRLVALKMLLAAPFVSEDSRRRFRREAQAIARLHHANIVHVYDVGETTAGPYFSLEFVENGSLAKHLDGTPWNPRDAAAFVERLAGAIHYAHEQGVIHRDLKPANILLEREGERGKGQSHYSSLPSLAFSPKISDFGLAKCVEDENAQTPNGTVLGTPSYLAPEQVAGASDRVGPATDVYGLGAILYELLTGQAPFRGDSVMSTLLQVTHQEPVPPSRLGIKVPRDLETICLKCLHKSPIKRYASARLLADDLHRFLVGEPILARPPGPGERTIKWAKRNPALSVLFGAILLALLLGGGTASWFEWDRQAHMAALERDRHTRAARVVAEVNKVVEETIALHGKAQGADRDLKLWTEAAASATRAESIAATGDAPPEIRTRVGALCEEIRRHEKNHRLIASLLDIQASMGDDVQAISNDQDFPAADARYTRAFLDFDGTNLDDCTPENGAALLRSLGDAVRVEMAAAVDNWSYVRYVLKRMNPKYANDPNHLHQVSQLLDPDPLRNRLRDAIMKRDPKTLANLAAQMDPAVQPVQTVNLVGVYLYWMSPARDHAEEIAFLKAAQAHHTRDFQINHNLAYALTRTDRPDEAVPYAMAAVAIRSKSAAAWQGLANALGRCGRESEALTAHRRAAALAPRTVSHLYWAGYYLERQGKRDEARAVYREAAQRVPRYHPRYPDLRGAWKKFGLLDEVVAEFRTVIANDPTNRDARQGLCTLLYNASRWADFVAETEQLLPLDSKNAHHHYYLGLALRYQGKDDDALRALGRCLAMDPKYARAQRLSDEIRRLMALEEKLPAILGGKSASTLDQLDLAISLQRWKHRYRDAAALYELVFAAEPKLAEDVGKYHRYNAACAAALAAAGGTKKLPAADRVRLRKLALDWLTADLTVHAQQLADRLTVAVQIEADLKHWQDDGDFFTLRDERELAKLEADERAAWTKLWSDVAQLAQKASRRYTQMEHKGYLSRGLPEKSLSIKMTAGTTYRIDMESPHFNTCLRLEDNQERVVADNDDIGITDRNSRIVYTAPANGPYRVVATPSKQRGAGAYKITIREFIANKD